MPEIIEVRKYSDFIKKKLLNKNLINIKIRKGRYKTHGPFNLYYKFKNKLPTKIINIGTKGKLMYISFENNYHIIITLGLSGGWIYTNKKSSVLKYYYANAGDYLNENLIKSYNDLMIKHRNILFESDKYIFYFCDMLSFGTIKILNDYEELLKKLNKLGPDIMDITTTFDLFKIQINKTNDQQIGLVLLNQKIISGLGNYLRSDILWLSRISPFRFVRDLSNKDLYKIYINCKALTWGYYDYNKGIKYKYITKNFKFPENYNRNFFVYKQKTDIYNNKVSIDELFSGSHKRHIHWVPKLQK